MGAGYPEVIQRASQMEGSSKNSVDTSTHDKANVKTDLQVCPHGKSNQDHGLMMVVPDSWEDIPDEVPPDQGPNLCETGSASRDGDIRDGGSKAAKKASFVSAGNTEKTPDYNGALEPTNTNGPPIENHGNTKNVVHDSSPISKSNEGLGASAIVVPTKLSSRKEVHGPH